MRIELITIGDELLLGFTVDTNAAHLARELAAVGIEIVRRATVGDEAADIAAAVGEALARTGAVITTGGLGPTSDDLTKPAIAALFGREMRFEDAIWQGLRQLWATRGWAGEPPEANKLQAMIPEGATVLVNRHGSAPGIWLEDGDGRWVAMLPGVPREMRGMLGDELLPRVRARAEAGGSPAAVVVSRTLRTTGIAESALAERLGELARRVGDMPVASLPGTDGVDLRVTARGLSADAARTALDRAVGALRERVGPFAYGTDGDDLAAVVLGLARARQLRIAVAESCTGGMLGARITAVAGSSDVMLGGVIAYANAVKTALLGVDADAIVEHGAVSEPVVRAMASGVRRATGAEIGVAITGVAGPGGGSAEKPVGTVWLGVDAGGSVSARRVVVPGDRDEIRRRAAQAALDLVRRALSDGPTPATVDAFDGLALPR
jgi:nicotinamide-nucleotide amidase